MLSNNLIALVITFAICLAWLRLNDFAAHRGWVSGHLSRKIIHIGTGPIFVVCWLLFNQAPSARFLAALIPFAITGQFALVGFGVIKDEAAVQAMSRTGDRREILKGPLYYGVVFVVITILYWKYNPIGVIALMLLCGGDGLAEVIGRRYGKIRLPWNKDKSWIGSFGMFLGGWLFALVVLEIYLLVDVFPGSLGAYLPAVTWIALGATLVESLSFSDIDNITITLTALILGHLLL
jgi:phytol kinase